MKTRKRIVKRSVRNPSTYVEITRPELEAWLDDIGFRDAWKRDERYAGVYLLSIGPNVAIRLASTIGASDSGKASGEASMKVTLVSKLIPDPYKGTLNKKAVVGSTGKIKHFHRTTNWRKNWIEGIDVLRAEYLSKQGFYERIAVERAEGERPPARPVAALPPPRPAEPPPVARTASSSPPTDDGRVLALRTLYARARAISDERTMKFAMRIAGMVREGVHTKAGEIDDVRLALTDFGVPYDYPSDAEYEGAVPLRVANPGRRRRAARR